jgi:hypothetical protein
MFFPARQQDAEPGTRIGVIGRQRERPAQRRDGLLEVPGMVERGAEIAPRIGEARRQRDGVPIGGDRLVEALERIERVAEAAMGQREIRLERDGATMTRSGLVEFLQLVQGDAEIGESLWIIGFQRDRAPAFCDRLVDTARQPAHLAQIGMVERHVGRELRRPPQVRDGIAEPPRLVGDNAEQMDGVRLVRLCRQDAVAQRLRLGKPAGTAVLLGQHEGIRQRHGLAKRPGRLPILRHPSPRRWWTVADTMGSRLGPSRRRRSTASAPQSPSSVAKR